MRARCNSTPVAQAGVQWREASRQCPKKRQDDYRSALNLNVLLVLDMDNAIPCGHLSSITAHHHISTQVCLPAVKK